MTLCSRLSVSDQYRSRGPHSPSLLVVVTLMSGVRGGGRGQEVFVGVWSEGGRECQE